MRRWLRTLATCLAVGSLGATILWQATEHGRILTTEGARRLAAIESPAPVPDIILTDAHGHELRLRRRDGTITLVEFIYTSCPTICQSAGAAFSRLEGLLQKAGLAADVQLLSVTFDLEHDGAAELEAYGKRHGADGRRWRVARPSPRDLEPLLRAFGVVVLPDPVFGFQHNAAIHMVSSGRLAGIFDIEDIDGVMKRIQAIRQGRT